LSSERLDLGLVDKQSVWSSDTNSDQYREYDEVSLTTLANQLN